jgi:HemY protein
MKRVKHLASLAPGDIEGPIAIANAAIEAHEWQEARNALQPYLDERPSARICTLMARIEAGELGDKGREREWLARALRAPRDRAWIADGYVSDRWLPVSPVTGAVDAFEWKAPMDAIGRGDDTLVIEERPEPVAEPAPVPVPLAPPEAQSSRPERKEAEDAVEVSSPREGDEAGAAPAPQVRPAPETPRRPQAEPKAKPAIFVPQRPPDDPGVAQGESDESPTSLERLRAAQIR